MRICFIFICCFFLFKGCTLKSPSNLDIHTTDPKLEHSFQDDKLHINCKIYQKDDTPSYSLLTIFDKTKQDTLIKYDTLWISPESLTSIQILKEDTIIERPYFYNSNIFITAGTTSPKVYEYAYILNPTPLSQYKKIKTSSFGGDYLTVVIDKKDSKGLLYLKRREIEDSTGRFTQFFEIIKYPFDQQTTKTKLQSIIIDIEQDSVQYQLLQKMEYPNNSEKGRRILFKFDSLVSLQPFLSKG